jgi:hypothetical protein
MLNVGSVLLNPYVINSNSTTVLNNNYYTISKAQDAQSIFFFEPTYHDRWAWNGETHYWATTNKPVDFFFRPPHFAEIEFGIASSSANTSANSLVGSGNLFGEAAFDFGSFAFHNSDMDMDWSLEWLFGGTTNNSLASQLSNYFGYGISSDFGIPVNTGGKIEILVSWFLGAYADDPLINGQQENTTSSGPATVEVSNGFLDYAPRDTGLLKLGFHYPIDPDRFFTLDATVQDSELSIFEKPFPGIIANEPKSTLDSWSLQIGYSQDVGTLIKGIFPSGSAMPVLAPTQTPFPTVTSTVISTPTPTPKVKPIFTPVK